MKTILKNLSKNNHRKYSLTLTHTLKESGDIKRLWVPFPLNLPYQTLISVIKNSGNYDKIFMSDFDNPTLYAKFSV